VDCFWQIGEDNTYAWKEKWWEKVYDSSSKLDALAALENGSDDEPKKKKKNKPKKKGKGAVESSDSDSDSSSDSSDSSDSDSDDEMGRDGIRSTATKAERKIAKQLAKDPWGRWGGREGKFARIRSYEQTVDTYLPDSTKKAKEEEAEKVSVLACPLKANPLSFEMEDLYIISQAHSIYTV
jgi:hypothetical protein